jgi:hypothetical protein
MPISVFRMILVRVAHWPATSEYANPTAVTGPVLNMLSPAQMPNCLPGSASRSPARG